MNKTIKKSCHRVKEQRWKVIGYEDGYDRGDPSDGTVAHKVYLKNALGEEITAFVGVEHYSSTKIFGPDYMDICYIDYSPRCPWGCKYGLNAIAAQAVEDEMDESLIINDKVNSF